MGKLYFFSVMVSSNYPIYTYKRQGSGRPGKNLFGVGRKPPAGPAPAVSVAPAWIDDGFSPARNYPQQAPPRRITYLNKNADKLPAPPCLGEALRQGPLITE